MRTLLTLLLAAPCLTAATPCANLAQLTLPHARIAAAIPVPAGAFAPPNGRPIPNLPAFCRITATLTPSPDSNIQVEIWLPAAWNSQFLGVGNGGFAGAISYAGLVEAVRHGYATASTDTGHQGGGTDASWALHHPEKITDFGHRAIHEMTVQAKALLTAHYGAPPRRSYFSSCSNGGRQALMEAQRYPADYDGILAGAPANAWTSLMTNAARAMQATAAPANYIPAAKLPAIQAAVLAACDLADGVKDNVLENPATCRFDPATLRCPGADAANCLTPPQVSALNALYAPLRDPRGKTLFPGYSPSGEAETGGWAAWITGAQPAAGALHAFSSNFFRYMVHSDPAWTIDRFDLARDLPAARKLAPALDATNPDLRAFHARGGKLILYHGWCDAAIPAQNAIDYYQSVVRKMGPAKAQQFVRLFLAPGVQHCGGGAGAHTFGQGGAPQGDPASNMAAALVRWVEQGTAPERIVATRPGRTRPLCAYPQVARYRGAGSTDDAANFDCAR
jgi:feruloyl esterase